MGKKDRRYEPYSGSYVIGKVKYNTSRGVYRSCTYVDRNTA